MKPRICLIHAVRVAIDPVAETFARLRPEAELMNLLDDSLALDRQRDGVLTPKMTERFQTLAQYAVDVGVNGILFSCSAFGPAIEAVQKTLVPLPVLKPNEAMFEEALKSGARLGLLASFEPLLAPMTEEDAALAKLRNSRATLITACGGGGDRRAGVDESRCDAAGVAGSVGINADCEVCYCCPAGGHR